MCPDQVLGSTSLFGTVDTGLFYRQRQHFRTIESRQRYKNEHGDLPETEVKYDPVKDYVWLGAPKVEADVDRVSADILRYLSTADTPKTRAEIESEIGGNTGVLRKSLHKLVADKIVKRSPGTKVKPGRGRTADVYSIK